MANKRTYEEETQRNALVKRHIGLVHAVSKRYEGRSDCEDIFQVGCIGLLNAIDRFDESRGFKFSTYAVQCIQSEISNSFRHNNELYIPRAMKRDINKVRYAKKVLTQELHRESTALELAMKLGITLEELQKTLIVIEEVNIEYLDAVVAMNNEGDAVNLGDAVPDNSNGIQKLEQKMMLEEMLSELQPLEKQIIELRYYQCRTQSEIMILLGMSQSQVSRAEKKALIKMRKSFQ